MMTNIPYHPMISRCLAIFTKSWLLLTAGILLASDVTRAPSPTDSEGDYLIRGVVTKISGNKKDGDAEVTIRIVDVYLGPESLIGKEFTDVAEFETNPMRRSPISPMHIPDKNDEGIWSVAFFRKVLRPEPYSPFCRLTGIIPPFLEKQHPRYSQVKQLANAIHSVDTVSSQDAKDRMFSEYSCSEVPEISLWAARSLGVQNKGNVLRDQYAKLPVMGRLAYDEWMETFTIGNNFNRMELLQSLLTIQKSEYEEAVVFSHIMNLVRSNSKNKLSDDCLYLILSQYLKNKAVSSDRFSRVFNAFEVLAKRGCVRALDALVEGVENGELKTVPEVTAALRRIGKITLPQQERLKLTLQNGSITDRSMFISLVLSNTSVMAESAHK